MAEWLKVKYELHTNTRYYVLLNFSHPFSNYAKPISAASGNMARHVENVQNSEHNKIKHIYGR